MKHRSLTILIWIVVIAGAAAQTSVSTHQGTGKTLPELAAWVAPAKSLLLAPSDWKGKLTGQVAVHRLLHLPQWQILSVQTIDIPRWSPDDLPFFCKIEHKLGKKMPLLIKFRLGSVEYVDWMEGKHSNGAPTDGLK